MDFNQSMAVIYDQGHKVLVSVVNVKDPAAVLPANVVQQGKQGLVRINGKLEKSTRQF